MCSSHLFHLCWTTSIFEEVYLILHKGPIQILRNCLVTFSSNRITALELYKPSSCIVLSKVLLHFCSRFLGDWKNLNEYWYSYLFIVLCCAHLTYLTLLSSRIQFDVSVPSFDRAYFSHNCFYCWESSNIQFHLRLQIWLFHYFLYVLVSLKSLRFLFSISSEMESKIMYLI